MDIHEPIYRCLLSPKRTQKSYDGSAGISKIYYSYIENLSGIQNKEQTRTARNIFSKT